MIVHKNERWEIQIPIGKSNRRKFKKNWGRGIKITSLKCCQEKGCFVLHLQGLDPKLSVGKKDQRDETLFH